jgi:hypothetical protein
MTELPSSTNSQIGEVELTRGSEHVTYLRTVVDDDELHSQTRRDDRIDGTLTLDLSDAKKVIKTDCPEELPNVEPVEGDTPMYSCNLCGVNGKSVLRYKSKKGMFPISFHYECLREFAKESVDLFESNVEKLVVTQL